MEVDLTITGGYTAPNKDDVPLVFRGGQPTPPPVSGNIVRLLYGVRLLYNVRLLNNVRLVRWWR